VKKNREVLGRLINVTCFLEKQELAFRGHDESSTSLNKGNYIELIFLLGMMKDQQTICQLQLHSKENQIEFKMV
jgi:hypothetical protein